jgi:hypothetical protein
MKVRGALAAPVLAVALIGCGSGSAARPTSNAQLIVVSPTPGEVTGANVAVKFDLIDARVVNPAVTKGQLRGDQGHIHVLLDQKLVSMYYTTEQTLSGVTPGLHSLQGQFVAIDHLPFRTPVLTPTVAFQVKG